MPSVRCPLRFRDFTLGLRTWLSVFYLLVLYPYRTVLSLLVCSPCPIHVGMVSNLCLSSTILCGSRCDVDLACASATTCLVVSASDFALSAFPIAFLMCCTRIKELCFFSCDTSSTPSCAHLSVATAFVGPVCHDMICSSAVSSA